MKKIFRVTGALILLFIGAYAACILIPRTYKVASVTPRPDFHYWDLPTGSHIAWKKLEGKGTVKHSPIVYIHGGPGGFISPRLEQSLQPLADSGYDVYLYDQAGGGLSGRLEDIKEYTALRHQHDLEAIVRQIGSEKVIVYGHSWGAILACIFTAGNPVSVEKLILSGPGNLIPVRKELALIQAPDSLHLKAPQFSNAAGNRKANNLRTYAVADFAMRFGIKLAPDDEMDDFQTYLNGELNKSTVKDATTIKSPAPGGGGYYAQLMTLYSFATTPDSRSALKKVNIPVLILRGQYDNQKWGYVTEYLDLMPQSRLIIIPDAGHSISFDQPAITLNALLRFLEDKK
jgi:proline iminopeptidase